MAERTITIEDLKGMDLDALQAEIQELEGNLELYTQKARQEIDGRKAFLKALEVLKNGKPARKPWTRKPKPAETPAAAPPPPAAKPANEGIRRGRPSYADTIHDLLRRRPKLNAAQIAKDAGIDQSTVLRVLNNDDRFDMDPAGLWSLL